MINVAVIGAGIGAQHVAAYASLPNVFNVVRVVDLELELASALAKCVGAIASVDAADALEDLQIDVIDICLPPNLHVEYTLQALAKGKHVICEKPVATSLADANNLRIAAQAACKKVYPVFQYRWGPPLQQLEALIVAGLTGAPQVAALETHWMRDADYYSAPWRGTWAGEQGGAVLGHAIHAHDLLCTFFGPVRALSAFTTTRANPIETEDCAAISFEMATGALATSNVTLGAAHNETRLKFVFAHLTATSGTSPYAPGSEAWTFEARQPSDQAHLDAFLQDHPFEEVGFKGFLSEVAKDVSGQRNSAVTLEDGIRSIELVTAIYHAARAGTRVTMPISEDHPLFRGWMP